MQLRRNLLGSKEAICSLLSLKFLSFSNDLMVLTLKKKKVNSKLPGYMGNVVGAWITVMYRKWQYAEAGHSLVW